MKSGLRISLCTMTLALLVFCTPAFSGVNLPWSTTFDCYEWAQGQSLSCDSLTLAGGWTACGKGTEITSAANNSAGGGGRGARWWNGDGQNVNSGPLDISFNTPQRELYIRWHMRYQQGFQWNPLGYDKHWYLRTGVGGTDAIPEFSSEMYRIAAQNAGGGAAYGSNAAGWSAVMGGPRSDGRWHSYEIHLRMDTNGSDGVAEMWIDGVKKFGLTNVNYSGGNSTARQGWVGTQLNSNQNNPANGTCMYVDYDDVSIRTTGPIGPAGSSGGSTADTSSPTTPSGLRASVASASQINLSWAACTDNVGVAGYRVHRNGVQVATTATPAYQNTALSAGTSYSYTVAAYDAAGNASAQSAAVSATTPAAGGSGTTDTTAPTVPANFRATVVSPSQINLSWTHSTDNVKVTGYRIYRNGSLLVSGYGTGHHDTGVNGSTAYSYTIAAYDAAGNVSAQSAAVSATTPAAGGSGTTDTTAPTVPANFRATVVSPSQINLSWTHSTDNVKVTGYRIYRNGSLLVSGYGTGHHDTGVNGSTAYSYTIAAYDGAGNASAQSAAVSATTSAAGGTGSTATLLFEERFEDNNLASRGWYDNTLVSLSTAERVSGSTRSAEFRFTQGATTPINGRSMRKTFPDTDTLYVSYYVKYSANWQGSNKAYHPHEFYILSNKEGDWDGMAYNYLTTYIEQNEGEPIVAIQDGKNIDRSRINTDLTRTTEYRAVAGCNGDSDGYGNGQCYPSGSVYWNGKQFRAGNVYFRDAAGPYYKNDWHFVEVYIKLNSVVNGKGVADGVISYWYDGSQIIQRQNVMMRTGANADLKFGQFVIAPYIGDGSPVDQTFWIDNLKVATGR